MARVTQADLARELGVSTMTVSLALRGHHRISKATRKRVWELAEARGYRPDPILSELGSGRWKNQRSGYLGTVAFVTQEPKALVDPTHHEYYLRKAMENQFSSIGYRMDAFALADLRSPAHLASVMRQRGIQGFAYTGLRHPDLRDSFPWGQFASIALNYSVLDPPDHSVVLERFQSMCSTIDILYQRGYRRVGIIGFDDPGAADLAICEAALAYAASQKPGFEVLPMLRFPVQPLPPFKELNAHVQQWLDAVEPDAVITWTSFFLQMAREGRPDLAGCVFCITEDMGFSGFHEDLEALGRAATDLMHALLRNGRIGLSSNPVRIIVPRKWIEKESLPWREPPAIAPA